MHTYPSPKRFLALAAALGLTAATTAFAGNLAAVPMTMTPIYMGTANVLGMIDAARQSMPKDGQEDDARGSGRSSPSSSSSASLLVGHDPAVTAQAREAFLGGIAKSNGQTMADEVDRAFGDIQTTFGRAVGPFGLHSNDFADVMTAYTVMMWMAANRQLQLPQPNQVHGVQQQMHAALAGKQTSDQQRQLLAETMMYQTCIVIVVREQAANGKPELMETLASAIDNGSAQNGSQLRQMALTDQGLVRR